MSRAEEQEDEEQEEEADPAELGQLSVSLSSASMFLQDHLAFDVRDSAHRPVGPRMRGPQTLDLAPGLYSVDAVHEDGSRWSAVTQVRPRTTTEVHLFGSSEKKQPGPRSAWVNRAQPAWPVDLQFLGSGGLESCPAEGPEFAASSEGVRCVPNADGSFDAEVGRGSALPAWACFTRKGEALVVMLPVNTPVWTHDTVASRATIRFLERSHLRAVVELDERRRVLIALRSRVERGMIGEASELARDATALLLEKYSDPVGAAFGALFLHRIKHLDAQADWVANLANGFPWLRDAQILRASLQARGSAAEREEAFARLRDGLIGFRVALFAGTVPYFLFSEAFSLALSLLRRWPADDEHRDEREELILRFAPLANRYDYGSTFAQLNDTSKPEAR